MPSATETTTGGEEREASRDSVSFSTIGSDFSCNGDGLVGRLSPVEETLDRTGKCNVSI